MGKSARSREKQRLREEFANNWSIIGYRYLYFDHGIRKTFWMLLLIAATGLSGFLFYGTVFEFFAYDTFVINNVDYSMEELPFPTVTFCNLNPRIEKEVEEKEEVDGVPKKGSSSMSQERITSPAARKSMENEVYLQLRPQKYTVKTLSVDASDQLSVADKSSTTQSSRLNQNDELRAESMQREENLQLAKENTISRRETTTTERPLLREENLQLAKEDTINIRTTAKPERPLFREESLQLAKEDTINIRTTAKPERPLFREESLQLAKENTINIRTTAKPERPLLREENLQLAKENTINIRTTANPEKPLLREENLQLVKENTISRRTTTTTTTTTTKRPSLKGDVSIQEVGKTPTVVKINTTKVLTQWITRNKVTSFREAINKFEITYDEMINNQKTKNIRKEACIFENEVCRRDDIRDTMSWDYSLCYQFNSFNKRYAPKNSSSAGMNGGLNMFLNIAAKNSTQNDFVYDGMALIINPFGIPHMLQEYNDIVLVQPGTMNAITLEVVKTQLLPKPYATACGEVKYKIITHYPYSKGMCEVDCILQRIVEKCRCVGFEFEGYSGNVSICSVQQMKCFYKYRDSFKRKVPRVCRDSCPRECISYRYHIQTTQASIGNNHVYSKMADGDARSMTKEFISENLVGFQISFRGINQRTSVMTPAATWRSLLGEIGGNLGLCMGLSVLTVFELIFFLYDYTWVLLCGCTLKDDHQGGESQIEPQIEMTR